jgi:steroid delta-isomerase-like uncharacterized protein
MTTTHTVRSASATTSSALVRRFVDDVLNRGRFDALADIVHPDYRYEGPDGAQLHGPLELEQLVASYRSGFSDFHAVVTSEVESGGLVAMTMKLTGTHDGEFEGLPPTGARMSLPIAVFTRVEGNRIIEDREFYDTATLLAQLGLGTTAT